MKSLNNRYHETFAQLYKTSNYVIPARHAPAKLQTESSIIKYFLDSGSPDIRPAMSPE
jgi:hypothetical protein